MYTGDVYYYYYSMCTNAHIYTHKEDSESETCPRERS